MANEVLYNLSARGIEYDLVPFQQAHHIATIGYSPFNSGAGNSIHLPQTVLALAQAKQLSPHQLMLAWALRSQHILSIPKTASPAHMQANLAAQNVTFTAAELGVIDAAFPAPTCQEPLKSI